MEFSDQIKQLRKENQLSQTQFAEKLHITRQAVSNWENNRNLPDLEMLIEISQVFHISLDQLILGDSDMNKMTEKLIKDTDENRKAKYNMITALVGGFLMILGFVCFFIKANSVEYIDKQGILHENFYLIPAGYVFLFAGIVVLIVGGIAYLKNKHRR
ncbi:DUF3955 domain-containing protein [uncultured Lactobacillus sp.]|uniref:DUF3955 domain-containing protein n=1 Tax=uncultured Lactobacillus sp. TaxID=153152 RepID=UPI0028057535|nr:DUF3955 domain-containing protein [uncultured Lactobacillus sp.]